MSNLSTRQKKRILTLSIATVVFLFVAIYLGIGLYFTSHFFYNTKVNGIDASTAKAGDVKKNLEAITDTYFLRIETKEGSFEAINREDVGMQVDVPIAALNMMIKNQNPFAWPMSLFDENNLSTDQIISIDDVLLAKKVSTLNCVNKTPSKATKDAYIEASGDKYIIVDEVYGEDIDSEKLTVAIKDAMSVLADNLAIDDADCYVKPAVLSTDKSLVDTCAALNNIMAGSITYTIGGAKETITAEQKRKWIIQKDGQISLDEEAIAKYIDSLGKKYNTVGKAKTFACGWDGHMVTCPAGTYGWKIDAEAEKTKLIEDLGSGKAVTRNPVYSSKAAGWGANEIGGTFVEVDITHQMAYGHVNGEIVFSGPVVTGSVAGNSQTVIGAFAIYSKQRDRWLNGPTWHDWVSYWMPFYTDYGIHDATWREEFGGDIYLESGSHGCVNMPLYLAQLVYDTFPVGTPVLCYYQ